MKKFLTLFATAALLVTGCGHDMDSYVEISPNALEALKEGGELTIQVHSNTQWTFVGDNQAWYTASPVSGEGDGTVVLTLEPNTTAAPRAAAFRVAAFGISAEGTLVQAAPAPPASVTENTLNVIRAGGPYDVQLPAGYTFTAESAEDWVTVTGTDAEGHLALEFAANPTAENRTATVTAKLTDGSVLANIDVVQSWRNIEPGEMLIEEIFFASTLIPESTGTYGDQYVKLTNNSDHTLYADGLSLVISSYDSQTSSAGAYWAPPELPGAIGVKTIYRIPGAGRDVPVEPGASLVIAVDAQNYSAEGGVGIDLSKADFEFNDVNEIHPDIDNPDVPDMDCWVRSSVTITSLHNRGYGSFAIVTFPTTLSSESFFADYAWKDNEDFWFRGTIFRTRQILDGNYTIPNAWVVDGVNCGVEEYFRTPSFNETVDAGYTGCGKTDGDPDRFGKCPRRKVQNGKLVDTNNSSNDFDRDAKPSLAK